MPVDPSYTVRLGWFATDLDADGHVDADMVPYDNGASGLTATDTQAAIDELAGAAPASDFGWFNVKDYGAVGDGSTDDTSAIDDAIAALNTATRGVLYFPAGTYKTTAALTTITASCTVMGDGMGAYSETTDTLTPVSVIDSTSATAVCMTFTGQGATVRDIAFRNTSGSASAGSAVSVSGSDYNQKVDFHRVLVAKFYDGLDIATNSGSSVVDCAIWSPVHYGIKIRNTVVNDAGGASVVGTQILHATGGPGSYTAGIRIESSGGNKVVSTNILGATKGIDLEPTGNSVILLVSACSIESFSTAGLYADGTGHSYADVTITGCEFGQYSNGTAHAISITAIDRVAIDDNIMHTDTGTPTAIVLDTIDRVFVGAGNVISGYGSLLSTTSVTNLIDGTGSVAAGVRITGTPTSGQVPTATSGTAATWQTPSSGVTLSNATPLVESGSGSAGTGTDASRDDHVHPAAAATAGGELVISSTHSSPLVFGDIVQTSAGDDFIYSST